MKKITCCYIHSFLETTVKNQPCWEFQFSKSSIEYKFHCCNKVTSINLCWTQGRHKRTGQLAAIKIMDVTEVSFFPVWMSAYHITSYCYFQDFIRSYKIRFYFGPSIENMAELLKFQGHQDINYINYVEIPGTPIHISLQPWKPL